ncbi:MAG: hypothetical protein JOZ53_27465 [Planctomycetaceae bacterium]|nr:hypothetical protein [Planctomycetaceae bacterium]
MPGIRTRLERLEQVTVAEVRCAWLYVGWGGRGCPTDAGAGVHRVFVPEVPAALPPGLFAVLRHPDRDGADVGAAAADWALKQLALGPRQRALTTQARILVLVTAGDSEPPPAAAAAAVAPPEAAVEPLPAAEGPPPTVAGPLPPAVEGPPPPAAAPPPPVPPQWPEWLPR